jgi:hypothetical protein
MTHFETKFLTEYLQNLDGFVSDKTISPGEYMIICLLMKVVENYLQNETLAKCHRFMRKGKRFCLICVRKINKLKPKTKPEIYLGKKEECASCGVTDYLFSTKKFSRKVCKDCKIYLEALKHLPNVAVRTK